MKDRKNTAGPEKRQGGGDKFIVMFDGQALCVAFPPPLPPPLTFFFFFFNESGLKLLMLPDSRFVIKMSAGSSPAQRLG